MCVDALGVIAQRLVVKDFAAMIAVVKGLGTTAAGPSIYVLTPPPLMKHAVR
jgi:hypothetical protein